MMYLLHATVALGEPGRKGAMHYLGWCREGEVHARLAEHRSGHGARITRAFVQAGGTLELVRIWPDLTRVDERRMKAAGHYAQHCPVCRDDYLESRRVASEVLLPPDQKPNTLPLPRQPSETGGGLQAGNQTSSVGTYRHGLHLVSTTSSGGTRDTQPRGPGGTSSTATARRSRAGSIWPAGTKLLCSWPFAGTLPQAASTLGRGQKGNA